jgi:hypothetical protein
LPPKLAGSAETPTPTANQQINVACQLNLGKHKGKFSKFMTFCPVRPAIANMSVYPIVKLPRNIKKAYQEDLSLPIFNVQKVLSHPGKPPQRLNLWWLGAEACAVVVCGTAAYSTMGWFVSMAVTVSGLLFLLSHLGAMQTSYSQRWYVYRQQVDQFQRQEWEADFDRTRSERLQTPEGMSSYRRHRVAELLAQTTTAQTAQVETNIPPELAATLADRFPGKIQVGVGSGLMLIDQNSRLHISILVDQVPQRVAGIAAGSFIEDDQYLAASWIVVRFSAEQARQYPDSCCKTLAEIGGELLQNANWLEPFAEVYDLWQIPAELPKPEFAVSQFTTSAHEARAS